MGIDFGLYREELLGKPLLREAAREVVPLMEHVRVIEVAGADGYFRHRCAWGGPQKLARALESEHAPQLPRRKPDFATEDLREMPPAPADNARQRLDPHGSVAVGEHVPGIEELGRQLAVDVHRLGQGVVEDRETLVPQRTLRHLFGDAAPPGAKHLIQGNNLVGQRTRWNREQRPSAAEGEVDGDTEMTAIVRKKHRTGPQARHECRRLIQADDEREQPRGQTSVNAWREPLEAIADVSFHVRTQSQTWASRHYVYARHDVQLYARRCGFP